jgi:hypothetical protein
VQNKGLGKLKKLVDLIENGTRDLPARSIVPQPNELPLHMFAVGRLKREF